MTTATKRRKLEAAEATLHAQWIAAWTAWGATALQEWRRLDPEWKRKHDELFQPLYREWTASVQDGDEAAFLARRASLAKWWESVPDLWRWLWGVLRGWLEQDLRQWPHQLPEPPDIPAKVLQRLMQEAATTEDHALILASCAAQAWGKRETAPRPGRESGAAGS